MEKLGNLSGEGTLSWRGNSTRVTYAIEGTYDRRGHGFLTEGRVEGDDGKLYKAQGRSDIKLTIADGRELEIALMPSVGGSAEITVNSSVAEFVDAYKARRKP